MSFPKIKVAGNNKKAKQCNEEEQQATLQG